jgi:hypothetical protein
MQTEMSEWKRLEMVIEIGIAVGNGFRGMQYLLRRRILLPIPLPNAFFGCFFIGSIGRFLPAGHPKSRE